MTTAHRALVTGAATGLGLATALALGRLGYDLAVTAMAGENLDELTSHPDLRGRRIVVIPLELRSESSIRDAVAVAVRELDGLDLLVNNAGRPLNGPAIDTAWDDWDDVMTINLKGAYFLAASFARQCIARRAGGAVVNMASTQGMVGFADRSVYGISKGGLVQMTRLLAIEWAPHGIRVNAVAPGTVLTPSRQASLKDPARRAAMLERIPSGRFVTAEEVAAAVCYLGGPAAMSVTGQILAVDGGLTAC